MFSDLKLTVDPCETSLLWLVETTSEGPRLGPESLQPERQAGDAWVSPPKTQWVWPVRDENNTKAGVFQRTDDTRTRKEIELVNCILYPLFGS